MELIKQLHTNDLKRYLEIAKQEGGSITLTVKEGISISFVDLPATQIQEEIELREGNKMKRETLKTVTTAYLHTLRNYMLHKGSKKVTFVMGKGWTTSDSVGETVEDIERELIRRGVVNESEPQQEHETPEGLREQAAQLLTRAKELEESLEGKAKEYYTTLVADETAWSRLDPVHKENVIRHVQAM